MASCRSPPWRTARSRICCSCAMDATCASTARVTATAACVPCSCLPRCAARSRTPTTVVLLSRLSFSLSFSLTPPAPGRVADAGHPMDALQPRGRPLHSGLWQPHRAGGRDRAVDVRGRAAANGAALDPRLRLVRGAAGARHRGRRRHAALCMPAPRVPDHDQRAEADVEARAAHDDQLGLHVDAPAVHRRGGGARHLRLRRHPLRVVHADGSSPAEHEQPARQRCHPPTPPLPAWPPPLPRHLYPPYPCTAAPTPLHPHPYAPHPRTAAPYTATSPTLAPPPVPPEPAR